MIVWIS